MYIRCLGTLQALRYLLPVCVKLLGGGPKLIPGALQALRVFKYLLPVCVKLLEALRPGVGLGLRLPRPLLRFAVFKLTMDLDVSCWLAGWLPHHIVRVVRNMTSTLH